jgi:hypothetical protein
MMKITCDNCGAETTESADMGEWILGYDLLVEAPHAVRRAIRFWDHWDTNRVTELGAIHLCSAKCRDQYLRRYKSA